MAEEDKEPRQPEEQQSAEEQSAEQQSAEQQPTEGATEEAKDEAPNPEKGDDKGSKSSSADKDDCTYCTCTIQERISTFSSSGFWEKLLLTPCQSSNRPPAPFLGSYGNAAGNKIESTLSPIGRPMGKGFQIVTKPVGGVVDAVVGGLIRSGAAYGEVAGVGAGNMDKKKAEEKEEKAERHEEVGGKEQTGENPLGIWWI